MKKIIALGLSFIFFGSVNAFADRAGTCSSEVTKSTCEGTYQLNGLKKHHCHWKKGSCH